MRESRQSGSEGGGAEITRLSLPLSLSRHGTDSASRVVVAGAGILTRSAPSSVIGEAAIIGARARWAEAFASPPVLCLPENSPAQRFRPS